MNYLLHIKFYLTETDFLEWSEVVGRDWEKTYDLLREVVKRHSLTGKVMKYRVRLMLMGNPPRKLLGEANVELQRKLQLQASHQT